MKKNLPVAKILIKIKSKYLWEKLTIDSYANTNEWLSLFHR
jgi:hypothetical protein